jgi:hypothetical protein
LIDLRLGRAPCDLVARSRSFSAGGAGIHLFLLVNRLQIVYFPRSLNSGGKRMSEIAKKVTRLGLVAVLVPAALLAGCAAPQPAPPPPMQQQYVAPQPAPQPYVPAVRG